MLNYRQQVRFAITLSTLAGLSDEQFKERFGDVLESVRGRLGLLEMFSLDQQRTLMRENNQEAYDNMLMANRIAASIR